MQCFQCDQEAVAECPRCGAVYCDQHGDALCAQCMDPALALPSYRVYRGSLVALLIGSVFAVWLLVLPPAGADEDAPPGSFPGDSVAVAGTPEATPTGTGTPGPDSTATSTATPEATGSPQATETPTATPTEEPTDLTHTVVPGDTVLGIAGQYLPPGRLIEDFVNDIVAVNGIVDPTQISVGDVLTIPQ